MTRSVVVRMRRRAPTEFVEPWRLRLNGPEAEKIADRLREWSETVKHSITWPVMPEQIEDRNADVWEALLAVADAAGQQWPERARRCAVSLVTQSADRQGSLGVTLLRDLRDIFDGHDKLSTEAVITALTALDESPWGDLRGKPIDARSLARRLSRYGIKPKVFRDGDTTIRGYDAVDLADPWERYLPPLSSGQEHVTHVTAQRPPEEINPWLNPEPMTQR